MIAGGSNATKTLSAQINNDLGWPKQHNQGNTTEPELPVDKVDFEELNHTKPTDVKSIYLLKSVNEPNPLAGSLVSMTATMNDTTVNEDEKIAAANEALLEQSTGLELVATSPELLVAPALLYLSLDGKVAIAAGSNYLIFRWSVPTGDLETLNQRKKVCDFASVRSDARLVYSSADFSIWDMVTGKQIRKLDNEELYLNKPAGHFLADKSKLVLRDDGRFLVWDLKKNVAREAFDFGYDKLEGLISNSEPISGTRSIVATASSGEYFIIDEKWKLVKKTWKTAADSPYKQLKAISKNGKHVVISERTGRETHRWLLSRLEVASGKLIEFDNSDEPKMFTAFSPGGDLAITRTASRREIGNLKVVRISNDGGKEVAKFPPDSKNISFGFDGKSMLTYHNDKRVRIWKLKQAR